MAVESDKQEIRCNLIHFILIYIIALLLFLVNFLYPLSSSSFLSFSLFHFSSFLLFHLLCLFFFLFQPPPFFPNEILLSISFLSRFLYHILLSFPSLPFSLTLPLRLIASLFCRCVVRADHRGGGHRTIKTPWFSGAQGIGKLAMAIQRVNSVHSTRHNTSSCLFNLTWDIGTQPVGAVYSRAVPNKRFALFGRIRIIR